MLSVSAVNENGVITFKFDGKAENLSVLLRNVENVKTSPAQKSSKMSSALS